MYILYKNIWLSEVTQAMSCYDIQRSTLCYPAIYGEKRERNMESFNWNFSIHFVVQNLVHILDCHLNFKNKQTKEKFVAISHSI